MEKLLHVLSVLLPIAALVAWSLFMTTWRKAKFGWASYAVRAAMDRAKIWRILAIILTICAVGLWVVMIVVLKESPLPVLQPV